MKFGQLLISSIISLNSGKYMVNILYELLFSSTVAHKTFSICLTCMAVHRYFLQFSLSPASVCYFSERDKFWREIKKTFFRLLWNQENKNGARSFFSLSLCFPIVVVFRKEQRPFYVCQLPPDFFISNFTWCLVCHFVRFGNPLHRWSTKCQLAAWTNKDDCM